MLTKDDIELLKEVFATKEDIQRFATKDDLKRFATKDDLKAFATKQDFYKLEHSIKDMAQDVVKIVEMVGTVIEKLDDNIQETRGHRVSIGDHEKRLKKVENQVFS